MKLKRCLALIISCAMVASLMSGCASNASDSKSGENQVVIYSNADEEAVTAMENALNAAGYEGKLFFRPMVPQNWEENCWRREPIWKQIW